ncbi:MAG: S-layer homology domain-containing protein [Candidatus Faecousia sp.]|uniref:S-layer homology domain-containing protein n=1 Tax=Faecousia sp. TaxID=2952921 RepID=UPI002A8CE703|nr:S-layer homology domain-containing protein [Candidatus Faecousia sp.]
MTVQNVTVTGGGTGIAARKGTLTLDNATVTGTTQALQSNYSNDCVMVIQNGSALSSTGDHVIKMSNGTLTIKDGTFTGGAKGTIGYSQLSTNTVTVDLSALSDPTGITIYNTSSSAVSAANIILPAGYTLGTESLASKTQYSISRAACASHTLTKIEAKTPTCTEDGNSEYWVCDLCGKFFSDENGTTETTAEAVKIPAAGHSLTKTETKAPTCTEGGNSAYWTCSVCGKYFSDENGENEIAKDSWVISATGHSLTKTEDGGSEYWVCDLCGKFFSDENGTTEITPGGETYRVAGVAELCGSDWNPADDNNLMTLNADTGLYEKTYTGVQPGEYPIKVVGTRSDGTMNWYGNAQGMNVVIYVTAVCDVTVVFNATTHDIGIVGISAVEKTWMDIDAIRVVGNGDGAWLNGANWDPAADANKMTEVRPGVYEITYAQVPAGSDYQFKFAANGSWADNWGAGGAAGEAVYNSNTNISLELTETTDVTLRLNLNGFNESTKQGATYEVVLGSGDDTGKVAVDYLDAEGNSQTCAAATVLAADTAVWEGGWYVAQGKVTIPDAVTLNGDVHLILADECTLTAGSGIAGSGTLTVYAQSTGEQKGSLTATGIAVTETDAISAGIHAGSITVNGGVVNATGGAGEGSDITSAGLYSTPGNITINDGVVTATGGTVTGDCGESVGIATEEADIIVNGGTVNATGAASATWSIGVDADWGGFRLSGGSVTATGRDAEYDGGRTSARSIGLYADDFAVSGGELTATSGTAAGNMPETYGISCSNARIDGGTVIAEAGAASGGSSTGISNYDAFTATGGQVIATSGAAAWSTGIDSYGDAQSFSISGDAAVEATGGESTSCSAGVYAYSWDEGGTVSISDHASLLAIGKHSDVISFGVYAESSYTDEASSLHAVQVTGGDLNVICFGADDNSYGIFTAMVYTPSGGEPTVQDVPGLYVSDGHVRIHNTYEGAQDHSALNAQPDLSGYGSYRWRTGMEDGFTPSTIPYEYSPTHSFVEFGAAASYGVTVNGVEVDEVNYTDVLADGVNDGKVSYDPATNTLTVSGTLTDAGYTIIPLEIAGNGTTDVVLSAESSTISAGMKVFAVKDVTATAKSGNPAFTGAVDITCSGDVTLANSGDGMTVADALTVNGAQDVTVTAAGASQVISGTTVLSCSGNVSIVNSGTGMAVSASLSVTGAKDVTVTANANNPTIDGNADISCSGNVTITNKGTGMVMGSTLTVTGAKDVTVTANTDYPAIASAADITCSGDVKLVNLGGGRAIGGTLEIRKTDAHGYAVKTGADLDNLTVYAEKAAGETFGPESLSASVVKTSMTHSMTKTEAKEPTCTEDGNSAYWTCSVCGKFFSDEEGTTEIEKDSWVIEAKGHSLTKTEAKAPTCTEDGNSEYWTCSVCGKFFSDEDGTTEIEKDSWIIEAKGHSFGDWTVTKEPTCTEAGKQMRVCTVCGAVEEASVPACACPSAELTDVPQDAWYHTAVDFMVMHELMLGVDEGRFAPESTMTRAQLVTVLYRIAGEPETDGTHGFTDVADGMWYTDAIAWAVQSGVVNGIGDDKFDPDGYVTREQIATILFRYTKSEPVTQDKLSAFPDADKASSYAVDALNWAVAEGLINGSDGKLLPGETATRAQAAAILTRFLWNNA